MKALTGSRNRLTGTCFVLAAACLWGSMGIFVRRLTAWGWSSLQMVEVRSLITAAVMGLLVFFKDRSLLRVRLRDLWCFAGTGIVSITFFSYCYFRNIGVTSLSTAAILLYTSPIFVMLFSAVLFRERITGRKTAALIVAFAGCVLVSGGLSGGFSLSREGLLYGLGSGIGYALYSIFCRYALDRGYSSLTITVYTFLFASAGGAFLTDWGDTAALAAESAGAAGFLLLYAAVTTILPYLLYTQGLSRMETSQAAVIASVEPVVATLIGFAVFGETPTAAGFAGMALVLGAVVLLHLRAKA